jgi:hypothetical protein
MKASRQTNWSHATNGEEGYLFGVSLCSVNCYARMVPSTVNLVQGQPTSRDDGRCALLPDQFPL